MDLPVHEWPGYVPHDVTVIRRNGETWHWDEYWAVDKLQIQEFLELHDVDPIWMRAVEIPEPPLSEQEYPLDLKCDYCGAEPQEPCDPDCLGLASAKDARR